MNCKGYPLGVLGVSDREGAPPALLVKYITEWISDDSSLCASSVLTFSSPHMMREGSEKHCPLAGLLKWCAVGPLVEDSVSARGGNSVSPEGQDNSPMISVFSTLHWALLQTLLHFSHEHCTLLTLRNLEAVVLSFQKMCKSASRKPEEDLIQFSVERLGQAIQVALASGNLRCSKSKSKLHVLSCAEPSFTKV